MATSQNHWPVIDGYGSPYLTAIPKIIGKVRKDGGVAETLAHVVAFIDTYVEDVDRGRDDWGYNYRPIRGQSSGFSNHASGTAIDLNAMLHPRGKVNTFNAAQRAAIRAFLRDKLKGTVRWGGDYDTRIAKRDDMHFEIDASAAELRAVLKGLGGGTLAPAGSVKPKPKPKPAPAKPVKANSGNSKADNIAIAKLLNYLGYDAGYPDGIPGARLRAGVKAYQKAQRYFPGMKADGDWGSMTQDHYDWVKELQDNADDWAASKRLGWLVEDGDYAAVTERHIKAIQEDNPKLYRKAGGRVADGEAGPITCKMLGIRKHPSA